MVRKTGGFGCVSKIGQVVEWVVERRCKRVEGPRIKRDRQGGREKQDERKRATASRSGLA